MIVFCGASGGNQNIYAEMAESLGKKLADSGIHAIYGGANIGLMGIFADSVLKNGGTITGIIPGFLENKEIAHTGLTSLEIVATMHERKQRMYELGDAVIALPGGWGTMDELFEMLTWGQIGLHEKPIGVLNVNGYYDALDLLMRRMVADGFLRPQHLETVHIEAGIDDLLAAICK